MTTEEFNKLREWIIAIIDEKLACNTSDGGLIESVRLSAVEAETRKLLIKD
jgi:hypothetical protein